MRMVSGAIKGLIKGCIYTIVWTLIILLVLGLGQCFGDACDAIIGTRCVFGFTSVQRATCLLEGSRVIERSSLIGGHCGGMDGAI